MVASSAEQTTGLMVAAQSVGLGCPWFCRPDSSHTPPVPEAEESKSPRSDCTCVMPPSRQRAQPPRMWPFSFPYSQVGRV